MQAVYENVAHEAAHFDRIVWLMETHYDCNFFVPPSIWFSLPLYAEVTPINDWQAWCLNRLVARIPGVPEGTVRLSYGNDHWVDEVIWT